MFELAGFCWMELFRLEAPHQRERGPAEEPGARTLAKSIPNLNFLRFRKKRNPLCIFARQDIPPDC